jgi:DNA polymerase III subunit epsilon
VAGIQRSFDDLGIPLFEVVFCTLDLETTGGSPAQCAITEIGAVKHQGGETVGTFQTLVNPGGPIPPFITILTGITQAMVVEAPRIETALPAFLEFLGDSVIVGHNVRFDLSFLNWAALSLGYGRLGNRAVDTVAFARRLVRPEVRNLTLGTLAAHFRSPVTPTHRALDDARATAHVFHALLERAGTLGVTALDDLLALPTAKGSPFYQKIRLADELPRRPGVYLFKDRDRRVFYVGKADNLRTRVRSYFYGDERRTVGNMLRELATIDYRVCENSLEAEIVELRLIHSHRPRYNRRSLPARSPCYLKLTKERFPRLSIARSWKEDGLVALGPFRSRRSAELVMTALWDVLPLRRCTGAPGKRRAPCAPAQMGMAMCPCDGSLTEEEYGPVIDRLLVGLQNDPGTLLRPLQRRMLEHASARRFEEAAWARDRYRALARAIERRRAFGALSGAGLVELESVDGDRALIDSGRLVAAWGAGGSPPLLPSSSSAPTSTMPVSVEAAEEAHLIWRWMTNGRVMLVDSTNPMVYPASPIPDLVAA